MTRCAALLGFGCVLAGCDGSGGGSQNELPDVELSTLNLDFGDVNQGEPVTRDITLRNNGALPMGVGQIVVAPDGDKAQDYEQNFTVLYDFAEAVCDEGSEDAKGKTKKPKDSGEETGFYDTADTGEEEIVQQVLNPGCELPLHVTMDPVGLGEVQAGLLIVTMDEPTERDLGYYRDPDEEFKIVKLEGVAVDTHGAILVDPLKVDFGFVWAGEVGIQYPLVRNVGQSALTIESVDMADNCIDSQLTSPNEAGGTDDVSGTVLEPGESIALTGYYKPLTPQDATDLPDCDMFIHSDDPNEPNATVELKANVQGLSEDTPPSVHLISPAPGHVVNSGTLTVEVDMWDANQPANSLDCYVRSDIMKMSSIGDCTPDDQSGHVIVHINADDKLEAGVDTISVIVTDAFGQRAEASTTIRYLAPAPENDADGDLFTDHNSGGTDCDDSDATIYPEAAELPDGKDNNCEPAPSCVAVPCLAVDYNPCIDEGTRLGDDDKDCFVEAPTGGDVLQGDDCNDWPTFGANTFPGAPEVPDNMDNNCDPEGTIDEGTSAYDDDGDGYDELNGDYKDDDPAINPAAIEFCDGIDNDCDDIIDNAGACIPIDSRPVILGGSQGVWAEKTDIGTNESTTIGVYGFDADGDQLTYVWTQDDEFGGHAAIDASAVGPVVTLTAPNEVNDGQDKYRYDLQVQVADPDGNLTWAYGYIWVHDGPVDLTFGSADSGGCNKDENQAFAPLLPLALLALAGRRRRSKNAA